MTKQKAIKTIREKYLVEYQNIFREADRIQFLKNLLALSVQEDLKPYILLFESYIATVEKEYDKAFVSINKAIELDQNFAFAMHVLALIYDAKGQDNKAIEAYQKAIELDPDFAYPWYSLGRFYYINENFDAALEALGKSIAIDIDFGDAWNGLALTYEGMNESQKAIEAFEKAIKAAPENPLPLQNIAQLFEDNDNSDTAIIYWQKALEINERIDYKYGISLCEKAITRIKVIKQSIEFLAEEQLDRSSKVLKATRDQGIEEEAINSRQEFLGFIKEKPSSTNKDDTYFQVLRRWNSYTPIIADNYHISKGGGYFLKVQEKGFVIDPGFNFIDNFKGAKFNNVRHRFWEIDKVFISHAHNDHTADLESILTLLHKYNHEIKGDSDHQEGEKSIRSQIAKEDEIAYENVSDKKVEAVFLKSKRRKVIDLYMTKSIYKKYMGMFDLFEGSNYNIHIVKAGWKEKINGVIVEAIAAKHMDIISDRDSVGFIFQLENSIVVYTGDTGWNPSIEKNYKKIARRASYKKKKHKLLIAHLGGFKDHEKHYANKAYEGQKFYKNHLGRLGVVKINEVLKPDVCFISEFGEELKGHRIDLAQIYNIAFDSEITFLPADIGLCIDLETRQIEAITSVDIKKRAYTKTFIKPHQVKCELLNKDYSIHYYKGASPSKTAVKSSVNPVQLIQVLGYKYDDSTK